MPTRTHVAAKQVAAVPALPPPAPLAACMRIAATFLGDAALGKGIHEAVSLGMRMKQGADAELFPAPKRKKLQGIVKAITKLDEHINTLDRMTIANALGRTPPSEWYIVAEGDESALPPGTRTTRSVASHTPALLEQCDTMVSTMRHLRAGLVAQLTVPVKTVRGVKDTPVGLMFALEGLAVIWRRAKGKDPLILSFKQGQFGLLALEAVAACGTTFSASQVRTGLRRLHEKNLENARPG